MQSRGVMVACLVVGWAAWGEAGTTEQGAPGKAPFRVLYSNDTTHIQSCTSPFHKAGERFRGEMLEATVDETANTGIDVHMLQPGTGWVPWWKSRVYPYEEHVRFMKERYGKDPSENGFAEFMAGGGDMVALFVARCRARGLVPFVSLRLNDGHALDSVNADPDELPDWAWRALTPMYADHPEWRIGPNLRSWGDRVQNWAIPAVRQLKYDYIEEVCEGYDIDGFELDFMRYPNFFDLDKTPSEERHAIMTDFVKQVRACLDRTAKHGQHRWLCVRIPCYLAMYDALGIDVAAFAEAGVDMFNLSAYYFTEQQTDAAAIRRLVPNTAVYLEMTDATTLRTIAVGSLPTARGENSGDSTFTFRRTTDNQFYTTAHLAYARGLDGVSAFNFVYYREHACSERGPFSEPPFHVFEHLADPAWLARQPQHYIVGKVWSLPGRGAHPLPKTLNNGQGAHFALDMAPPVGGWTKDGRLRIQAEQSLGDSVWTASVNGEAIEESADRSEPYDNPYPPMLGTREQHRAWIVPVGIVKDGVNHIEVRMEKGDGSAQVVFLDLAIE